MAVRISKNSRLRTVPLVTVSGFTYWDMSVWDDIPVQPDEIQYTPQVDDRIDLLAYRFYGDPVLWWVLAVANGMEDLPTDLKYGVAIRVPSKSYVFTTILARPIPVF